MMMFRSLTLQEATLLLPLVKEHFARIFTCIADAQHIVAKVTGAKAPEISVSLAPEGMQEVEASKKKLPSKLEKKLDLIESAIIDEIAAMQRIGANVKSIMPGQVTFLSQKQGRPVLLSWQYGDSAIEYWHDAQEPFSNRHEIEDESAFGKHWIH